MNTEPTTPLDPPPPGEETLPLIADAAMLEATIAGPRVRWAGIIWGALFAILAATAMWLLAEASRVEAIAEWLRTLAPGEFNPGWVIGFVALAGGLLLLLLGGLALIRSAQLRATAER